MRRATEIEDQAGPTRCREPYRRADVIDAARALGELSRALVVARRTGQPRENLPVVLGTLVSQATPGLIAALAVLGAVMFSSVDIFSGHQQALLIAAIVPPMLLWSSCWRR